MVDTDEELGHEKYLGSPTMAGPSSIGIMNLTDIGGHSFQHSYVTINNRYESVSREGGTGISSYHFTVPPGEPLTDVKKEMLSWLEAPDFRTIYHWALQQRLGQTGTWFMQLSEFEQFVEGKKNVLWVTGMPGAGKTVLGSTVVKHLEDTFRHREDIAIVCAFLRYTEPQPVLKILAGLLSQLLATKERAYAELLSAYQRISKRAGCPLPTVSDLLEVLQALTISFSKLYVVLDGLDEASNSVKEALMRALPTLDINLFILSRPLDLFARKVRQAVQVTLYAHVEDIDIYITERIGQSFRMQEILEARPDAEIDLRARIKSKSEGMFLVAKLQMDSIVARSNSIYGLFEALRALPSGVNEMYEHTMCRINAQTAEDVTLAHRVLVLLLQVIRESKKKRARTIRFPPSVDDIRYALALNLEEQFIHPDKLSPVALIISACCGLVIVDEVFSDSPNNHERYKTLRFIHYSAPVYLEEADIPGLRSAPDLDQVLQLVSELQEHNDISEAPKSDLVILGSDEGGSCLEMVDESDRDLNDTHADSLPVLHKEPHTDVYQPTGSSHFLPNESLSLTVLPHAEYSPSQPFDRYPVAPQHSRPPYGGQNSAHDTPLSLLPPTVGSTGIIILLMGQTGAGKSHFINSAAGRIIAPARHGVAAEDYNVQSFTVDNPNVRGEGNPRSRVVLVDTPGLNNGRAELNDIEIIRRIGVWLNDYCNNDALVAGIIFIHDITDDRANVYADAHAWPIRHFTSPAVLQHLVLTTGKWDLDIVQENPRQYIEREQVLRQKPAWRRLLNRGASLSRYEGNHDTAWKAINKLLAMPALRVGLIRKDFNLVYGKLPNVKQPKSGIWQKAKNLVSRD